MKGKDIKHLVLGCLCLWYAYWLTQGLFAECQKQREFQAWKTNIEAQLEVYRADHGVSNPERLRS